MSRLIYDQVAQYFSKLINLQMQWLAESKYPQAANGVSLHLNNNVGGTDALWLSAITSVHLEL